MNVKSQQYKTTKLHSVPESASFALVFDIIKEKSVLAGSGTEHLLSIFYLLYVLM